MVSPVDGNGVGTILPAECPVQQHSVQGVPVPRFHENSGTGTSWTDRCSQGGQHSYLIRRWGMQHHLDPFAQRERVKHCVVQGNDLVPRLYIFSVGELSGRREHIALLFFGFRIRWGSVDGRHVVVRETWECGKPGSGSCVKPGIGRWTSRYVVRETWECGKPGSGLCPA